MMVVEELREQRARDIETEMLLFKSMNNDIYSESTDEHA
jgi:hypothetical protein